MRLVLQAPITRHTYHIEGGTDLSVIRKQSEEKARDGEQILVHIHLYTEPCPGKMHEIFLPEPKVSEAVEVNSQSGILTWKDSNDKSS